MTRLGPIGRLGRFAAQHFRLILLSWLVVAAGLGAFAPKVEHALAGAGWEATGSQSVAARSILQADFNGNTSSALQVVVHVRRGNVLSVAASEIRGAEALLRADPRVRGIVGPVPGASVSRDGRTAVIEGLAAASPNDMVRAADALQGPIAALSSGTVTVRMTGDSVLWSDFNAANRSAMLRSEVISWPVTLGILLVAFGSLVAAGLPLMLAILGLVSTAGMLDLATHVAPVSIWAMNFALMFALALGIDYALFVVVRFRAVHVGHGRPADEAAAIAMDTAGKAVLLSGITVLVSLSAVMLVPSPAFRSMALGIMLAVVFVLAATLTLLPAVLARLGARINKVAISRSVHSGEHRSPRFGRWAERLWRQPVRHGLPALLALIVLALPVIGLRTAMPSIKVVPPTSSAREGYQLITAAFGPGAPGQLEVVVPAARAQAARTVLSHDPGIAGVLGPIPAAHGSDVLLEATPVAGPSSVALGSTIDRLRRTLPQGSLVGGAAAENHDLQAVLASYTPVVMGIVLALGFLLLVVALQAPLAALLGVVTNLLATGAAFGVGRLVFQGGLAHALLGFEPQGFLDAWAPVFFFAMIFAIGMDYTVFLLASAKEHWEHSADAREAMVGGLAHSGRTILAAAGVMVAVFFTFALSGPLPPKEMGIILGVAVLVDAGLIRLVLLPVLLRLTGRKAWWLPAWARRVLPEVSFGHDSGGVPASATGGASGVLVAASTEG